MEPSDLMPSEVKPGQPGIYHVEVIERDPMTHEPTGTVERFARFTGRWWCNWALTPRDAAKCEWPGPKAGYRWRKILRADSMAA